MLQVTKTGLQTCLVVALQGIRGWSCLNALRYVETLCLRQGYEQQEQRGNASFKCVSGKGV